MYVGLYIYIYIYIARESLSDRCNDWKSAITARICIHSYHERVFYTRGGRTQKHQDYTVMYYFASRNPACQIWRHARRRARHVGQASATWMKKLETRKQMKKARVHSHACTGGGWVRYLTIDLAITIHFHCFVIIIIYKLIVHLYKIDRRTKRLKNFKERRLKTHDWCSPQAAQEGPMNAYATHHYAVYTQKYATSAKTLSIRARSDLCFILYLHVHGDDTIYHCKNYDSSGI